MNIAGVMKRLSKYYFPVSISLSTATLALVYLFLDPTYGILGAYAVVGTFVAAALYYGAPDVVIGRRWELPVWLPKLVYVACLLSLSLALLTGQSLWVVMGLLVGSGVVIVQLSGSGSVRSLLTQLVVLFLLSPAVKYLNSGFVLAGADVARHVSRTQRVLRAGSVDGLFGSRYFEFPGLHLLTGSMSLITDLIVYDAMMILAPAVLGLVVILSYIVTQELTGNARYALCVAFAVTLNDIFLIYSSIFHPQSLAFTFVYLIVLVWAVARDDPLRYTCLVGILVVALILTHHITQVLFGPVVLVMLGLYLINQHTDFGELVTYRPFRTAIIMGVTVTGYWILVAENFVLELQAALSKVLLGGFRGSQTQVRYLQFGDRGAEVTVSVALRWLLSPFGLYLISLLALFSVGAVAFMRRDRPELLQRPGQFGIIQSAMLTGMLSAAIMFDTLIGIKSLKRIRLPWVIPFSLVVGYGIYWVATRYVRPAFRGRGIQWRHAIAVLLLISLATTAPLATGDDYYNLDPRPSIQNDYSEGEYRQIQVVAAFLGRHDNNVTTLYATRLLLRPNGVRETRNLYFENDEVIVPSGNFVYREQWSEYSVQFRYLKQGFYSSRIVMSDAWLYGHIQRSNKTYTSGQVGLLWSEEDRQLDRGDKN